jgi:hypothetical protein
MSDVVITLDTDWAPDLVIDFVAERLVRHGVRATWFVTHLSPAIERLRQHPELFELGIHPNFDPPSTHGDTPARILRHCMGLVPDAISLRTHGLVQSTVLLDQVLAETPIKVDVSLYLPHVPGLCPVEYWRRKRPLLRVPYFWEDDLEMERAAPCWDVRRLLSLGEGLKVFDFHPFHVYLNSADIRPYRALKERVPRLPEATAAEIEEHVHSGEGTRTSFMDLVEHLAATAQSSCIRDIYERWQLRRGRP